MNDIIILAAQLVIAVVAFLLGKFVFPRITGNVTSKIAILISKATEFIAWADEFMSTDSGELKMEAVVDRLNLIAVKNKINITRDQIRAIAQSAYDAIKAGRKQSIENEAVTLTAEAITPTIVINTNSTVVATNNVPPDALQPNEDGTVKVFDDTGNILGSIDEEQAERISEACTSIKLQ